MSRRLIVLRGVAPWDLRDNFPDAQAAKDYIMQYCTAVVLTQAWDATLRQPTRSARSPDIYANTIRTEIGPGHGRAPP